MESFAVVNVIASIVQLSDAAIKAAKACYQIYKHGATLEVSQLMELTDRLDGCYKQMEDFLTSSTSHQISHIDKELLALSVKCRDSAQRLRSELRRCTTSSKGLPSKTLAKYMKTHFNARKIEKIKTSLENEQSTLEHMIQMDVGKRIRSMESTQSSQHLELRKQYSMLAAALVDCHTAASNNLRALIRNTCEVNSLEHKETRQQIQDQNTHEHEITRQELRDFSGHVNHALDAIHSTNGQQGPLRTPEKSFLESLLFEEMNYRKHEIIESYRGTFAWVFRPNTVHHRASLIGWLQNDDDIYWISGKAGSGKSTLMKFIINNGKTCKALETWAGEKDCLRVSIFFSITGSVLQRNLKGFLCSFLHQLLQEPCLLRSFMQSHGVPKDKIRIGDWSISELQTALDIAVRLAATGYKICVFLDGLDEFDRGDVDKLVTYIRSLCTLNYVKACISSRPENYLGKRLQQLPFLRLQDLTEADIRACVEEELKTTWNREDSYEYAQRKEALIRTIVRKADGVFLWVQFALRSVRRGIENEDDFRLLNDRLEDLPSGMEELYQEMWKRHNGDEKHYQKEATKFFMFYRYFPMTVFEMMVACDPQIQEEYLSSLSKLDTSFLAAQCHEFQKRIQTRCAGLLQITGAQIHVNKPGKHSHRRQSLTSGITPESSGSFQRVPTDLEDTHRSIGKFHTLKISFIHRTARDFLLSTEAGHRILGPVSFSQDNISADVVRGRMAAHLQALRPNTEGCITKIMTKMQDLGPELGLQLMRKLRQICDESIDCNLSSPDGSSSKSRYGFQFDCGTQAVTLQMWGLARLWVNDQHRHMSSYYLGHLFCRVFPGGRPSQESFRFAELLVEYGADLRTKHCNGPEIGIIQRPVGRLLQYLFRMLIKDLASGQPRERSKKNVFGAVSPTELVQLLHTCIEKSLFPEETVIINLGERPILHDGAAYIIEVKVGCVVSFFYWLLDKEDDENSTRRSSVPSSDSWLKVIGFKPRHQGAIFHQFRRIYATQSDDAVHLGEALLETFRRHGPGETKKWPGRVFENILGEAKPRCELFDYAEWLLAKGLLYRRSPDTQFLSPTKQIDETNWWDDGWGLRDPPIMRKPQYGVCSRGGLDRSNRRHSWGGEEVYSPSGQDARQRYLWAFALRNAL